MYGKLFLQMYDGTLATVGPWQALVTFQQMIILANDEGVVDMTPEAISRRTTIPLEVIKIGIVALEQPDSGSRSPGLDGRRIVRLAEHRDWGWSIVNHAHYKAIKSEAERREYQRTYYKNNKKKKSNVQLNSTLSTNSSHTDTDTVNSAGTKSPAPLYHVHCDETAMPVAEVDGVDAKRF
jgi:hypothetical protein